MLIKELRHNMIKAQEAGYAIAFKVLSFIFIKRQAVND